MADSGIIVGDGEGNFYFLNDWILKSNRVVNPETVKALKCLYEGERGVAMVPTEKGETLRTDLRFTDLGGGIKAVRLLPSLGLTVC